MDQGEKNWGQGVGERGLVEDGRGEQACRRGGGRLAGLVCSILL